MAKKKVKEDKVEEDFLPLSVLDSEPEPEAEPAPEPEPVVEEEKLDEEIEIGYHAGNPMRVIRDKDGNFVKMVSL